MDIKVGFIGFGLIGGSIARALKKSDSSIYMMVYSRSINPLMQAKEDGVIDEILSSLNDRLNECDFIFLCAPVEYNESYLKDIAGLINENCIISDVGSVKSYIYDSVHKLNLDKNFIGGHPMAGSEKTGYSASTDILLQNAYYAITRTDYNTDKDVAKLTELVRMTGAIPIITDPVTHDYAVAGISHVPHLIASSLVNLVKDNDTDANLMKTLAAGGFKDITRIASSSAEMWSQICMTNDKQIVTLLDRYIESLNNVRNMIIQKNRDGIYNMFIDSKEYRDSIGINKGPISKDYTLYCDIEDKEGAISSITLLLSDNHINIRNIEIIHNREFVNGVLLIAFYDQPSMDLAFNLLSSNNYTIYR